MFLQICSRFGLVLMDHVTLKTRVMVAENSVLPSQK